jgi:hypothetical protein
MVRNNRKGRASVAGFNRPILYPPLKFCGVLKQEATARIANRRLPVNFKALIRRLMIGGHARRQ